MTDARRKISTEWIDSDNCDWPLMVKEQAKLIIRLRADLALKQEEMQRVNMMDPAKIMLLDRVAELIQKLANAYRNLGKELVYHLSHTNTEREK